MGVAGLFLVVAAGFLITGVVIEWFERRADRQVDADSERRAHARLMRELGRQP